MRRRLWYLLVGFLIAIGGLLIVVGLTAPHPSCCSKMADGMVECAPCAYSLFPNPVAVEIGILSLVFGITGLILLTLQPVRRLSEPVS